MNTLLFIGKCCFSAGLACIVSIACSVVMLVVLASIVDILDLNYKGNNYWAIHTSMVTLVVGWVISFGCFMSAIK